MEVKDDHLARQLHELIAALDRRVPGLEGAAESSIARDAAALRAKALKRLADLDPSRYAQLCEARHGVRRQDAPNQSAVASDRKHAQRRPARGGGRRASVPPPTAGRKPSAAAIEPAVSPSRPNPPSENRQGSGGARYLSDGEIYWCLRRR